jgi:hypothetical protein
MRVGEGNIIDGLEEEKGNEVGVFCVRAHEYDCMFMV